MENKQEALMKSLDRTRRFGTLEAKQSNLVNKLMEEDGSEPVGMGYFIANKADKVFMVDPWARVTEFKMVNQEAVQEGVDGEMTDEDHMDAKSGLLELLEEVTKDDEG